MNVLIKHKVFNETADFNKYIDKLVSADIITRVHKRITSKYSALPFSIRIRPNRTSHWYWRNSASLGATQYVTFYVDENVTLPIKIQTLINADDFTTSTEGILNHFTYLGEVLPALHIHCGFYRTGHLNSTDRDNAQAENCNNLVFIKLFNKDALANTLKRFSETPEVYFDRYHSTHPKQHHEEFEVNNYELAELQEAQNYYIALEDRFRQVGEIELFSQIIQNSTDFGENQLVNLYQDFLNPKVIENG